MKPKLTEKGITYKTISRGGIILLTIFIFFLTRARTHTRKSQQR